MRKGHPTVNPLWSQGELNMTIDSVEKDFRLEFQTPIPVCKLMASMIVPGEKNILEPSSGQGNILSLLKDYDVTAPKDFFLMDKTQRFDCVIMNPPFSTRHAFTENAPPNFNETGMRLGYYFLTECMKMSDHVIALMPWFTITDSDLRVRTLKNYGIKSVTGLPRKTFKYARIQTMVLDLQKDYKGKTTYDLFDY